MLKLRLLTPYSDLYINRLIILEEQYQEIIFYENNKIEKYLTQQERILLFLEMGTEMDGQISDNRGITTFGYSSLSNYGCKCNF